MKVQSLLAASAVLFASAAHAEEPNLRASTPQTMIQLGKQLFDKHDRSKGFDHYTDNEQDALMEYHTEVAKDAHVQWHHTNPTVHQAILEMDDEEVRKMQPEVTGKNNSELLRELREKWEAAQQPELDAREAQMWENIEDELVEDEEEDEDEEFLEEGEEEDEDEEFLEEGEQAGRRRRRRRRRRRSIWRRRRRASSNGQDATPPAPAPPAYGNPLVAYAPTKVQFTAMATVAYGPGGCAEGHPQMNPPVNRQDWSAFTDTYGAGTEIGQASAASPNMLDTYLTGSTNGVFLNQYNILKKDHGCHIEAPSQEYVCTAHWEQAVPARNANPCPALATFSYRGYCPTGSSYTITPPSMAGQPCTHGQHHDCRSTCCRDTSLFPYGANVGSAGKIFTSGDYSNNQYNGGAVSFKTQKMFTHQKVCVVAYRGTDESVWPWNKGNHPMPDLIADAMKGMTSDAIQCDGLPQGFYRMKKSMYNYWNDRKVGTYTLTAQLLMPECMQWYFVGHSLGGSLSAMAGIFGYGNNNLANRVFSFGALSVAATVDLNNLASTMSTGVQGFRMYVESDYAPDIHTHRTQTRSYMHVTSGIVVRPKCGYASTGNKQVQSCDSRSNGQTTSNSDSWSFTFAPYYWYSGFCWHSSTCSFTAENSKRTDKSHHGATKTYLPLVLQSSGNWKNMWTPGNTIHEPPLPGYVCGLANTAIDGSAGYLSAVTGTNLGNTHIFHGTALQDESQMNRRRRIHERRRRRRRFWG